MNFLVIIVIWLIIGIITLIRLKTFIRLSYKNTNLPPFWDGFMYGLYQWGNIFFFPVVIYDWYCWKKRKKKS